MLLISPKCHPELAGVGVEYSWGIAKKYFRKQNDCIAANLHANIQKALSIVTLENVWKSARRTRDYVRAYQDIAAGEMQSYSLDFSHSDIEKMRKEQKTHRNILDMEKAFLKTLVTENSTRSSDVSASMTSTKGKYKRGKKKPPPSKPIATASGSGARRRKKNSSTPPHTTTGAETSQPVVSAPTTTPH